jgi:trimeric autotransporter adhesin
LIKKIHILCFLFVWIIPHVFSFESKAISQITSFSPQLISSTGNYTATSFGSISSSIGEPVITTMSASGTILTQGFQQPLGLLPCPTVLGSLDITANSIICSGENVTITPSTIIPSIGAYMYSWAPGGKTTSSIIVNPTITTVYTFSFVGCPNAVETKTVIVNPKPIPEINGTTTYNSNVCLAQNALLITTVTGTSTGPYSYAWSPTKNLSCSTCANTVATSTVSGTTIYTVTVTGNDGCLGICTASVTVAPKIIPNASHKNVSCFGKCNGTATINPLNGITPFSYSWSPGGETTNTIQNICPGLYSVTVTDVMGCNSNAAIYVSQPTLLLANVTSTPAQCGCNASASINQFGGTPPYTFLWSPGAETTSILTGLCGGQYGVTVTDALGCSVVSSTSITPSPSATIISSFPATICAGSTTNIGINAIGSPITYAWSNGNTTGNVIPISPVVNTTYSVVVTNTLSGCKDSAFIPVVVNPLPVPIIAASPSLSICLGSTTTLTASGGMDYLWSTNATTNSISVSPQTSSGYTVTAKNINGCSKSISAFMNVINVKATILASSANICLGETITLTGAGGDNYVWGNTSQSTSVITVNPNTTTTYSLVASVGNCTDTTTLQVSVGSVVATIFGNTTICLGGIATLTANTIPLIGNTYVWSTGQTTQAISFTALTSGINTYTVKATQGICSNVASFNINVFALPVVVASANDSIICPGDFVTLTSVAPTAINYIWSPGSMTNATISVSPSASVTYSVTVQNSNGCSKTATVPIVNSRIGINAGKDITICPGNTAQLNTNITGSTNRVNYLWTPGIHLSDSHIKNPYTAPDSTIKLIVKVTNQDGCSNKDTITVFVLFEGGCVLHIYSGITPNGDGDNDSWEIDGIRFFPKNNVNIFNRWGTKVWSAAKYDNKDVVWKGLDFHENLLPSGTYYYVISIELKNGTTQTFTKWIELTR